MHTQVNTFTVVRSPQLFLSQFTQALANAYINLNALATGQRAAAVARATVTAGVRRTLSTRTSFATRVAFGSGFNGFIARHISLSFERLASLGVFDSAHYDRSNFEANLASTMSQDWYSRDVFLVEGIGTYCANRCTLLLFGVCTPY